jgi:hypothetical protein
VAGVTVDPVTPSTVYAVGLGIFKSTNGGGNWAPVNTGLSIPWANSFIIPTVWQLIIDPTNSSRLYAATLGGGVFVSVNAGGSWSAINTGFTTVPTLSLAIPSNAPSTIYAGTNFLGIYKSTNGGASWAFSNTGISNQGQVGVNSIAIAPVSLQHCMRRRPAVSSKAQTTAQTGLQPTTALALTK